jgi:hypothetical protein
MDLEGLSEKENSPLVVWLSAKLNHSMSLQIISSLCGEYAKKSVISPIALMKFFYLEFATSFCKYSTLLLIDASWSIMFSTVLHP